MFPSTTTTFVTICGSVTAITIVVRAIRHGLIPLWNSISVKLSEYIASFEPDFTFVIERGWEALNNEPFRAIELYLPTLIASSTDGLLIGSNGKYAIPFGVILTDNFQGMRLEWTIHCEEARNCYHNDKKFFRLTCKRKNSDAVLANYFPHVIQKAHEILRTTEKLNIYTYNHEFGLWESTVFNHPSTFKTLAMEEDVKLSIIEHLETFVKSRDLFNNTGSAWKWSCLVHGPTGSGKTTLVAAVANYLRYDIYDLQLQSVRSDSELRTVLSTIRHRSILLIEDADSCAASKVTMSHVLNFIDGLRWGCGEEKIIIFTSRHINKLDPALLCPGRIDFQLEMGHCTYEHFKILAKNFGLKNHGSFPVIAGLLENVAVTPAEVAERFLRYEWSRLGLRDLLSYLRTKHDEAKQRKDGEDKYG